MSKTTPRRWFAFRLRTLLVVMVPLCATMALWARAQLGWIEEREKWIDEWHGGITGYLPGVTDPTGQIVPESAPVSIRIFGAHGFREVYVGRGTDKATADEAIRLFPEAKVIDFVTGTRLNP